MLNYVHTLVGHHFALNPQRGSKRGRVALPLFVCDCGQVWNPRQPFGEEPHYAPTRRDSFAPYHWYSRLPLEGVHTYGPVKAF